MLHIVGQQLGQRSRFLVFRGLARSIGRGFLLRVLGRLALRGIGCSLFLRFLGCLLLRFLGCLLLGILGGFLLRRLFRCLFLGRLVCRLLLRRFLGSLLLGDVGLLLLLGGLLLSFRLGLGCSDFLLLLRLGGLGLLGLASRFGLLLFRRLGRLALLLDFLLLHLLGFVLRCRSLLRLAGNFLVGLHGRLALRLELVQGRLHDRPRRRQFRGHREADEQHGKDQDVQTHRPDGRPKIAFRGRALTLLHQGASVISPTLPTPACCRPPMAAITAP
ncbi:hypothetical protein D3C75_828560 [compost metagenome]